MLVTFTVVPLLMTAAEKFNEAAYFYDRLRHTVGNLKDFPFNLSAFLAAARSTTLFLQKQYSGETHFEEWYHQKQTEMGSDPDLVTLNKLRVETIHVKPVNLIVQAGPTLPAEGVEIDGNRGGYLELEVTPTAQSLPRTAPILTRRLLTLGPGSDGCWELRPDPTY